MPRRPRAVAENPKEQESSTNPLPEKKRKIPSRVQVAAQPVCIPYTPRNLHPHPFVNEGSNGASSAEPADPATLRSLGCEACVKACEDFPKLLDLPLVSVLQIKYIAFRFNLLPREKVILLKKLVIHAIAGHREDAVADALLTALKPDGAGGDVEWKLSSDCALNALNRSFTLAAETSSPRAKQRLFVVASLVLPNADLGHDLVAVMRAMVNASMSENPLPLTTGVAFDSLWKSCGEESLPLVPAFNNITSPKLELLSPLFRLHPRGMRVEQVVWMHRLESGRLLSTAKERSGDTVETLGIFGIASAVQMWINGRESFFVPDLDDETPDWPYVTDFMLLMNAFNLVPYMASEATQEGRAVRDCWEQRLVPRGFGLREKCFTENAVRYLGGYARWWGYWSPLDFQEYQDDDDDDTL